MSNNGNVWDEVGGPLIIPSILLLVTTALELLSHVVTDTSLRVGSGMRELRRDHYEGDQPRRQDKGMHMQGASCEAVLRRLAGGKTTVLRSGPKLLYALYLVTSDTTTIVHLFFFVSAVLACTSSCTFALTLPLTLPLPLALPLALPLPLPLPLALPLALPLTRCSRAPRVTPSPASTSSPWWSRCRP